jgi:hypothetical protein
MGLLLFSDDLGRSNWKGLKYVDFFFGRVSARHLFEECKSILIRDSNLRAWNYDFVRHSPVILPVEVIKVIMGRPPWVVVVGP